MLESNNINNCNRCWEYFKCTKNEKENCTMFHEDRKECWLISVFEGGPRVRNNGDCLQCEWFKHRNES